MKVIESKQELKTYLDQLREEGNTIGFVPTMGALHEGHLSLIRHSQQENDVTVCSIFVNPTQFNDVEDFKKYPRNIHIDTELLSTAKCDVLFAPQVDDMYGASENVSPDLGGIDEKLEGTFRPGHFDGVVQIVYRLITAVEPDRIYMGLKDFQQQLIVKKMISSLELPVKLRSIETDREESGLARSSRNARLSQAQKNDAAIIHKTLFLARQALVDGTDIETIISDATEELGRYETRLEYFKICDANTLDEIEVYDADRPTVIMVAVWWGEVRLIDNLLV